MHLSCNRANLAQKKKKKSTKSKSLHAKKPHLRVKFYGLADCNSLSLFEIKTTILLNYIY